MQNDKSKILKRIKLLITIFITCLILAGLTALPVYAEMKIIMESNILKPNTWLYNWMNEIWQAVQGMNNNYPKLFYGFDWLAFAHIMIGIAFIGPYKDPIKNEWIIDWGMICCICVIPLAFIMGPIRGIPFIHILIDCSFGVIGIIPLYYVKKLIQLLK
jgi:hypothetical protein